MSQRTRRWKFTVTSGHNGRGYIIGRTYVHVIGEKLYEMGLHFTSGKRDSHCTDEIVVSMTTLYEMELIT